MISCPWRFEARTRSKCALAQRKWKGNLPAIWRRRVLCQTMLPVKLALFLLDPPFDPKQIPEEPTFRWVQCPRYPRYYTDGCHSKWPFPFLETGMLYISLESSLLFPWGFHPYQCISFPIWSPLSFFQGLDNRLLERQVNPNAIMLIMIDWLPLFMKAMER